MSDDSFISLLTAAFGVVTVLAIVAVAYRYRRWPVVRMIAASESRAAEHRAVLAALTSAMAGARADGNRVQFDRFAANFRSHRDALAVLDPKAPVDPVPVFDTSVSPARPAAG